MKRFLASFALMLALPASAALPPQYQNRRDLEVMIDFIRMHPRVESDLNAIDLDAYTLRYGRDCIARFVREASPKPPGWVGPADPLVFDSATCPVDYDQ